MYGHESWTIKKPERQRTDAFILWSSKRLLRVPWTARSNHSILKENNWIFMGRTDAEAEAPILWPSDGKNELTEKDPAAGKDWRQEEKRMTKDNMVGWHHQLNRHEFEKAPGNADGQGTQACCSPWGCKESDTTEWLNWTKLNRFHHVFYT